MNVKHALNRHYLRHGKRVRLELDCRTCGERWIWVYDCRLILELAVSVESDVATSGECRGQKVAASRLTKTILDYWFRGETEAVAFAETVLSDKSRTLLMGPALHSGRWLVRVSGREVAA